MVCASATGSTRPSTWVTSSSSKQRSTWAMASTSRMLARNWLPRPSPRLAPFTSPAMSTKVIRAGITCFEPAISASFASRGSGTATSPTLGSMVQKGKFAACAAAVRVSALKRVDLPTFGRPTMPVLKPMSGPSRGSAERLARRPRRCKAPCNPACAPRVAPSALPCGPPRRAPRSPRAFPVAPGRSRSPRRRQGVVAPARHAVMALDDRHGPRGAQSSPRPPRRISRWRRSSPDW